MRGMCGSMWINADQCIDLYRVKLIFIDQNWSARIFIDPQWDQFLKSDLYWWALGIDPACPDI